MSTYDVVLLFHWQICIGADSTRAAGKCPSTQYPRHNHGKSPITILYRLQILSQMFMIISS